MMTLTNIEKAYGRAEERTEILKGISVTVEPGQIVSILGRSGSGKSTLLNIATGMLRPTKGEISFNGKIIKQKKEFVRLRSKEIAYVWQGQSLLHQFTVLENICLPHYIAGNKEDLTEKAQALLDELGLGHLSDYYPSQISGGEARRVSVARALLAEPSLIVADEPTSNLDADTAQTILDMFCRAKEKGIAILCSTHDMDFLSVSDRIYKMTDGTLEPYGGSAE